MEHHPNQNPFTWKRMKPTACITAQYKNVTMMDFKVREGAENKHSWFFYFDKKPQFERNDRFAKVASNVPMVIKKVRLQDMPESYFPHFHYPVTLAKYSHDC